VLHAAHPGREDVAAAFEVDLSKNKTMRSLSVVELRVLGTA
jgi:hypothetical protein